MKTYEVMRRYIEATASLIENEGMRAVTARRIAAMTGTVASALYKHFSSIEELTVYASLRYRNEYYKTISLINDGNALDNYRKAEKVFAHFAFSNPQLFNNLVFGTFSDRMEEITQKYLMIFPEEEVGWYGGAIQTGSFEEGNLILLRTCVNDGSLLIREDEVAVLNTVLVQLFKGFLKTVLDGSASECAVTEQQYIACFEYVLSHSTGGAAMH